MLVGLRRSLASKLWALAFSGSGTSRTWNVQSYDPATSAWTEEFDVPETGVNAYGGIVITSQRVMIAQPGRRAVYEFGPERHPDAHVRSAESLQRERCSGRRIRRAHVLQNSNQIGYFRPLPTESLATHANALLTRYARSVRRLSLTLKPRTTLLPLPYATLVSVPAGTWGAAANWHLQSWDITLDTRKGWVHKLDLTSYPRRADTRVWERLTD